VLIAQLPLLLKMVLILKIAFSKMKMMKTLCISRYVIQKMMKNVSKSNVKKMEHVVSKVSVLIAQLPLLLQMDLILKNAVKKEKIL